MILAISKRWHRLVFRVAKWLQGAILSPLWLRLNKITDEQKRMAQEQVDLARLRLDICRRCPMYDHRLLRCKKCGCFMPAKVQIKNAKCPLGKW